VVGIKEGGWEVDGYDALRRQVRALRPDVAVCASGDEHLLACMVHGSDGSLVSLADMMPDEIVALDAAVRANDLPAARALHEKLEPLAEAIYGAPPGGRATARLKWCLREMGIIPDADGPPAAAAGGCGGCRRAARRRSRRRDCEGPALRAPPPAPASASAQETQKYSTSAVP
jgi:dihydrodipicolinate synthase/N-acetylneuraminate lyase